MPEKPYVIMLGSIFKRRFPDEILNAFKLMGESGPKLIVVGEDRRGAKQDFQAEIDNRGLQDRIIWKRYVEDEQLPNLISGAGAMLYLSAYEGFGLPPMEAMMNGVPAIVSDRGALAEVYGNTAILIKQESPEQIADAITALFSDKELWQTLSAEAYDYAEKFTIERMSKQTLDVILQYV
jgi:glycosyltransferase involved in cell wall biosynthesis